MKIAPYVDKLHNSDQYKEFVKENADASLVAGFFVLDLENGKHIHQLDYYLPDKKKIAAFTLDEGIVLQLLSLMGSKVPEALDIKTKIDLDALQGILEDEMHNRNMTEKVQKIIAVVQSIEGKKTWTLNCVLSGMHVLHARIEDETQSVLSMNKTSLFDYIKKVPKEELAKMKAKQAGTLEVGKATGDFGAEPKEEKTDAVKEPETGNLPVNENATKEEIKEDIKKLDNLEHEIEEEKKDLEKQLSEKEEEKK